MNESPIPLELGVPIERRLAPGETLSLTLGLHLGEFVQVTALQQGIDVSLKLFAPGEVEPLIEVDSPNGEKGQEVLAVVAAVAGLHRLEVIALKDASKPGGVTVKLDVQHPATDREHQRAEAVLRFSEGEKYRQVPQFDEALASYEAALGIFREIEDQRGEAAAQFRIGWVHYGSRRLVLALEPCEQAIRLYALLGDRVMEATVLNQCGTVYQELSRFDEALVAHRQAEQIFRELNDDQGTVASLINLGLDQGRAGLIEDAATSFGQAIKLADRFNRDADEVLARIRLAEIQFERGNLSAARAELGGTLPKAQAIGNPLLVALALNKLGAVGNREERFAEARDHYQTALEIYREKKDIGGVISTRTGLGVAMLKLGNLEEAKAQFQKVLEISRSAGDQASEAIALMNLARYHHARVEDVAAVAQHRTSLELFERIGDRVGIAASHFGIARSLCRSGDLESALHEIGASLAQVEGIRGEAANFDLRSSYLASKREYGDLQLEILMRLNALHPKGGYAARALAADEKQRARQLLDLLGEAKAKIRRDAPAGLLTEESRLRHELNGLDSQRRSLFAQEAAREILSKVATEERRKLTQLEQVRADIRRTSPRFASLTEPETLNLAGMQRLLAKDDRLLIYRLGESQSYLWAVSHDNFEAYELGPREQIERLADRFANLLASPDSNSTGGQREKVGQALADLILGPAKASLNERRLAVVADGALHRVPFAALPDPLAANGTKRPPLLKRVELVHLPSATVLGVLRREGSQRLPSLGGVAVFADAVFSANDPRVSVGIPSKGTEASKSARGDGSGEYSRLPQTRREADAILSLFPAGLSRSFFGFEARKEAVLGDRLKRYRILHFATHGQVDPIHPELSGLVFSQVDAEGHPIDGVVRLSDIYDLDLAADLVVLSACSTGVGAQVPGEGLVSLTRGFLYAGTRRLVVSLWPVPDEGTADLMASFYRHLLQKGNGPAAALRLAQLEMLDDPKRSDPFHWAAFTLVGDWRSGGPGTPDDSFEPRTVGGPSITPGTDIDLPSPEVEPPPPGYEEEGGRRRW